MGSAYPQPGLHSKFFDLDLEPLVEVVRDTVGRHDTFGLACTAKYYEDMGYFGHVNCSDNFNGELAPYTIEPRKGWPAINFFYNTGFDANKVFTSTSRGRVPATTCSCARRPTSSASRAPAPTTSTRRTGGSSRRCTCACIRPTTRSRWPIAHRVTPDAEPKLTKETRSTRARPR